MVRAIGSGARVTYDPIFGTPRELLRNGGYLTGPSRGTPVSIARGWIAAHRAALGLTANDVQALTVTRDYANPSSGTHVITFTQMFGGLPAVFGGRLNVAVTRSGRILSFTGDVRPSASLAAQPTLSISSAVAALAKSAAPQAAYRPSVTGKSGIWTQFAPGPFGSNSFINWRKTISNTINSTASWIVVACIRVEPVMAMGPVVRLIFSIRASSMTSRLRLTCWQSTSSGLL